MVKKQHFPKYFNFDFFKINLIFNPLFSNNPNKLYIIFNYSNILKLIKSKLPC